MSSGGGSGGGGVGSGGFQEDEGRVDDPLLDLLSCPFVASMAAKMTAPWMISERID
jgi:hypothetical protein